MRKLSFFIAMAFVCVAMRATAQEERAIGNFAGVGVRAMGMGGAFIGVADDFTALYWNPAGLAQLDHREVHIALLRNSHTNDATLAGTRASSQLDNTRFGSLGLVVPYPVYRGSLVFAAGINRVKDFDWSLRQQGLDGAWTTDHLFRHEGELSLYAVAGAVDVSPSISLGLTLGFVNGEDQWVNEFNWIDREERFPEKRFLARDTFHDEYNNAFYAILGAMIRSPRDQPRFRLGATVAASASQKISYTFRGIFDEDGYNLIEYHDGTLRENVAIDEDGTLRSVTVERLSGAYKLSLPIEISLGASFVPVPGVLLTGGVHLAEWQQSKYEGEDLYALRANSSFETQYDNVARYHLGVEWQVPFIALDLRAGFYTDPVPFVGPRDADRLPDPDDNPPIEFLRERRFATLGGGLLIDEVVQVDLAWVRGGYEQREGALVEDNTINRLFASVAYRF